MDDVEQLLPPPLPVSSRPVPCATRDAGGFEALRPSDRREAPRAVHAFPRRSARIRRHRAGTNLPQAQVRRLEQKRKTSSGKTYSQNRK